jgi:hypothetical protein
MTWQPISRENLEAILASELAQCSASQQADFNAVKCPHTKWRQSPWGDLGGGFWVVAVRQNRVLWYNDIEHGFNVSKFTAPGTIPENEYWCNQDELWRALLHLAGESAAANIGPLQPMPDT